MGRTHLFALACSVCVCLTAGSEFAWSQAANPAVYGAGSAMEPGNALVLGIREYRRGEYEQAARALKSAKQGASKLSPKDRKSLDEYLSKTEQALASRAQAVAQLQQAEDLANEGKGTAAAELLQRLNANPYLSQSDRVRVQALNESLRGTRKRSFLGTLFSRDDVAAEGASKNVVAGPMPSEPVTSETAAGPQVSETLTRADAKRLLEEGRQFLEKGFFDQAQRWALEANKYDGRWFFGDSPERLLRDIEFARARSGAAQPQTPDAMPVNTVSAEGFDVDGDSAVKTADATVPEGPTSTVASKNAEDAHQEAKKLLEEAKKCRDAGDLDKAKQLCSQSKQLQLQHGFEFDLFEETPEMILDMIQKQSAVASSEPAEPTSTAKTEMDGVNDPVKHAKAVELLKQARKAQGNGDMKLAVDLALQAQAMGVTFGPNEDSPEKIFAAHRAIRDRVKDRSQEGKVAAKASLAKQHMDAARRAADSGDYKEALRKAYEAADLKAKFESGEQTPEDLIAEIRKKAGKSVETPDAQPKTATALKETVEKAVNDGKFAEAREAAKKLESEPFGMKEDAEVLLASIDQAEKATGFLEAGKNALQRGDAAQAQAFFKEASKLQDALSEPTQQQLQELLQTAYTVQEGRANVSDLPSRFVNMQLEQPPAEPMPPSPTGVDPLAEARRRDQILIQQLRQEVISALQEAQRMMQTDPGAAIALLEGQRETVLNSELDRDLTTPMVQQIERRIRLYRIQANSFELQQREQERMIAQQIQRQRQDTIDIEQQTLVKELMKRYQAAMDNANYQEAETVAFQITEIAPDEVAGHAALWKAHLARSFAVNEDFEHRRQRGWIQALRLAQESAVPFPDEPPIVYIDPKEWENLTLRRAKYKSVDLSEKSAATEDIEKALERPVSFDFQETPLVDVVDFLREYTGVNIVLDPKGLDIVMVDPDTPVTLSLNQVQLRSALRLLLSQFELVALIQDDVLFITDEQETGQEPVTRVYPVADLVIPIIDFNSGGVGLGGALGGGNQGQGGLGGGGFGGFGGGGGGGGGGFGGGGGGLGGGGGGLGGGGGQGNLTGGGGQATGEDIAEEVIELIRNTISPETWDEAGGTGTIEYFQPNRSFVVTQTQEVHAQLADLLTQLRRLQDLQVSVEVRFITVEETFFERIGIDFDVTFDNNNDRYIQETLNQTLSPPGTLLVNQLGLADGNHVRGVTIGQFAPPGSTTGLPTADFNIPVSQSSFDQAVVPQIGNISNPSVGGTNFGIAFLNDIDVFLLLEAVQGDIRSNVAQAPKVTLFNGQTSSVIVADQVPFITDAEPVVSAGAVTFDPTITVLSDGTTLTVQAVVSADRRYVRLQVVPVITQIGAVNMVTTEGTAGGGTAGTNTVASINIQLPTVGIVSVLTTVSVPDGGTVLLGGLKSHQEARNEFGTPILSKLPYVNRLFKNAASARFTQSLLLMVTPRIIIQEEEEAKLGVQTSYAP